MRVAMYYSNDDIRLEEATTPKPGPGEILVRIQASGICGTDVMEWYRKRQAPSVLGHEITGEIAAIGQGVERFTVGDRVMATHHVPCNECHHCRSGHASVCELMRRTRFDPGGFAEFVRVAKVNVDSGTFALPDTLSFAEGSFTEPLACVVRAQRHAGGPTNGTTLVMGSGVAGLLHLQLAKATGADKVAVTDVNAERLALALCMGADVALDAHENVPARIREINAGRLADLVIVCTGARPAIEQAFECVERGGTLLFFATTAEGVKVPIPLYEMWHNEVRLVTSYAASPEDLAAAIELLRAGTVKVDQLISHRLPLEEAGKGFRLVANAQDSLKVIIEPQRP